MTKVGILPNFAETPMSFVDGRVGAAMMVAIFTSEGTALRRKPSAQSASIGVTNVKLAVESELGWLFREQPSDDYGIDAHIELVDDEEVSGRLLALQIKSGQSWFREKGPGGWWFRPSDHHVTYWLNHSLPVVIALFDPETDRSHWQLVTRTTLEKTTAGTWKLLIPECQVLDASAERALSTAAEGDPYLLRMRELRLAKPWMMLLDNGKRLVVDSEEWINKSSGRTTISLGIDHENGTIETLATWGVFKGLASYAQVLPRLFAWANVDIHEDTYQDAEYDDYLAECSFVDREGDRIFTEDFESWQIHRSAAGLRPYAHEANEVDCWRLELTLNDLGRAFLLLDEFGERA
jgi:hypothetical protein